MFRPPGGDAYGSHKTSGPTEDYGKTSLHPDLCKHFTDQFKASVTHMTPHKQDYTGRADWLSNQSVISQSDPRFIGPVSKAPRW